jgi:predicted Zn-dependent peptidase
MYHKTTLDNGLRLLTSAMPHTRSVSLGFFIGVGSRYETDEQGGVSHFIEHMLFKGTRKRPTARDVATAIEGVGGLINAGTDREATSFYAKVARPHLDIAMDVLVDILLNSRFEEEQIEKERAVIIEEINMSLDAPDEWVHLLSNRLIWPTHPLGRDVAGTKESVSSLGRENLLTHLRGYYVPSNTVLSIAGNIDHQEIVERVDAYLENWSRPEETGAFLPAQELPPEPQLCVRYRDTEQARFCLALPGLSRVHPDRFVLRVLNTILGGGMSSRLFLELRERQGLAYAVDSYVSYLHDTGVVGVYAGVDPSRLEIAVQTVLQEWDRLRQEEVLAAELAKAREFVKGRLLLQMENTFSVAAWFGYQELLSPEVLTVDQVVEAIDAVSAADIQRLAHELFLGERLYLTVVGPFQESEEDRLRPLLRL